MQHREHPDEGTIHAWLDGALGADEAAAVEAHVAACETCAAAVAEARGLIAASSRILAKLDVVPAGVVPRTAVPPTAPSGGDVTPIAERRRGDRRSGRPWWSSPSLRAAAVLLFVASGTLAVIREQQKRGERVEADSEAITFTSRPSSPAVGGGAASAPATQQAITQTQPAPPTPLAADVVAPTAPPSASPRPAERRDALADKSRRDADRLPEAAPPPAVASDFAGRGAAAAAPLGAPSTDRAAPAAQARANVAPAMPATPAPPSVTAERSAEERAPSAARKAAVGRVADGAVRPGAAQPTAPTTVVGALRDESRSREAVSPVVTGVVRDASSGAPLAGASVVLRTPGESVAPRGTVTDSAGRFSIATTVPGPYVVQARRIGYASATDTVVADSDRGEVKADFALSIAALRLGEVTVEQRSKAAKGAAPSLVARASGCYALRLDEPRGESERRRDEPLPAPARAAPRPSIAAAGAAGAASANLALPSRIVLETSRSRVEPLGYVDSSFVARELDGERAAVADARRGVSYWTPVPPDSVRIVLRDGAAGLELRARVERDGLRGTVSPFTGGDQAARAARPAELRARKVACP